MAPAGEQGYDVAVIGLAGRFPGAPDIAAFWRNLRHGVESISFFSEADLLAQGIDEATVRHPRYVKAHGVVEGAELWDAAFFGCSPREAETMDPQHRLFLECAWEALENAGYDGERGAGPVGVFGSVALNTYLLNNLLPRRDLMRSVGGYRGGIGSDKDYLATRVSYKLDLTGPSLTVQTACSSSLVAVHLACQSLLNLECDMALAGGVAISVPQRAGYWHEDEGIASPDGHCRAFDAAARGTVFGDGVGLVVLKRAADAAAAGDHVLALIKGSAINNDGGAKIGFTAPGARGQARVVAEALGLAAIEASTIGYVEAHGTGTALGDPIEIAALHEVFGGSPGAAGRCALGSVKTNVGHLAEAAGVAGLIKAVLALEHRELPPSLHYRSPNPEIDWSAGPFEVNTRLRPWESAGAPRRAAVSSFGIGGTNAHVVLEEAPPAPAAVPAARPWQVLPLSARSAAALDEASARLARHLRDRPDLDLADVAHTLRVGRHAFPYRRMAVARSAQDAARALDTLDARRVVTRAAPAGDAEVAFLLPGQGVQRRGMARELYRGEAVFRRELDRCGEILLPLLGVDLVDLLAGREGGDGADLDQTRFAQPAVFAMEIALCSLWASWGIRPRALLGHSVGEVAAACIAGVFSLADALWLVAERGRLLQSLPAGAMLAVRAAAEEVLPVLSGSLALAAANSPVACTVSGPAAEVGDLASRLAAAGVQSRPLKVSHAFHSAMMEPALPRLATLVGEISLGEPRIPVVSNLTGTWLSAAEATDPAYWAAQLRSPVRFRSGLEVLLAEPRRVLLEVGPGRTLTAFAHQVSPPGGRARAWGSLPQPDERASSVETMAVALATLALEGAPVDWPGFCGEAPRARVPLPTYPFERRRYWVDAPAAAAAGEAARREAVAPAVAPAPPAAPPGPVPPEPAPATAAADSSDEDEITRRIADLWSDLLGHAHIAPDDDFFLLGGDSLSGVQLVSRLQELYPVEVPLRALFEEPTLRRLSRLVHEALLAKLEQMSDEEARSQV